MLSFAHALKHALAHAQAQAHAKAHAHAHVLDWVFLICKKMNPVLWLTYVLLCAHKS